MAPRYLDRLRGLCLALPATYEKLAWNEPTFRIVDGKIFAMHASSGTHHSPVRPAVWLHASKENQLLMIADRPDRFFSPPYVGPGGWIGVYLDGDVPWDELEELIRDAWLRVAPKKVAVLLNAEAKIPPQASRVRTRTAAASARTASKSKSKPLAKPKPKPLAKRKPKTLAKPKAKSPAQPKPKDSRRTGQQRKRPGAAP